MLTQQNLQRTSTFLIKKLYVADTLQRTPYSGHFLIEDTSLGIPPYSGCLLIADTSLQRMPPYSGCLLSGYLLIADTSLQGIPPYRGYLLIGDASLQRIPPYSGCLLIGDTIGRYYCLIAFNIEMALVKNITHLGKGSQENQMKQLNTIQPGSFPPPIIFYLIAAEGLRLRSPNFCTF